MGNKTELVLFGGEKGWQAKDWTSSDDRVRGGKSQSYLDTSHPKARFYGTLDIKTLGGAGFASQRTTGEDRTWNLAGYDGILIQLAPHQKADGKQYTFVLKDEILPLDPGGREQSTISWEYDFKSSGNDSLFVPWSAMRPTYRGKEKDDAPALKKENVKRFSIMIRSFFGAQEGDFSVNIESVKAVTRPSDIEKGFASEKSAAGDLGDNGSWSWKNSRIVGLAVILGTTWAFCVGFCWYKGLPLNHLTPSNWWAMAKS